MATLAQPVERPKRGRKATAGAAPAPVETAAGFDYGRYNLRFNDPEKFLAYLRGYPDKSGLMGYIYRVRPKIDHSLIGISESSIRKTADINELSLEFVSATWGSGEFFLKVNDVNRPAGQQAICKTVYKVSDPDLVPIYDPRTLLVRDPQNADEVSRLLGLGVLVRDGATGEPRVSTAADAQRAGSPLVAAPSVPLPVAGASPADPTQTVLTTLMLKMVDRAFQPADNVLEQSFKIAERLNPQTRAAAPSIDEIADAVAQRMQPQAVAPGLESELERWEKMEAFLARVGAGRGAAGSQAPAAPTGWVGAVMAVPGILSGITQLVPEVIRGVAFFRSVGTKPPHVPGSGSNASQMGDIRTQPRQERAAEPSGGYPAESLANAPRAVSASNSTVDPVPADQEEILYARIAQVAQLALEKQVAGVSGFDFAVWLVDWQPWGLEVWRMLASKGTEGCLAFLAMMPQAAAVVNDEKKRAALSAWLDDFFSFDPDGSEEPEEEGGAVA